MVRIDYVSNYLDTVNKGKPEATDAFLRLLTILDVRGGGPPLSIAQIAEATGLTRPRVLAALRSLEEAGYVTVRRNGRTATAASLTDTAAATTTTAAGD